MAHRITKLTADDYDDICRVWSIAGLPFKPQGRDTRERIAAEMEREDTAFFGLFDRSSMLAIGLATYDGRKGWIQRVAVDPDHRGQGLGGEIVRACEAFLHERGAEVISCLIEEVNYPSISMFQKEGYSCWGTIMYFSKRPSDEA
jgi:ribosomal protein S18 acetylase RimI-like enzyme